MPLNATDFDNVTAFSGEWPTPDLSVIDLDRPPPPRFPTDIFGDVLSGWITAEATARSCPPDYIAATFLSAAAAMVGSSRRIEPWASWREPMALWTGCIGLPSSGKSPGADCVLDILREIEIKIAEGFDEKHREYLTDTETAKAIHSAWMQEVKQAQSQGVPPRTVPAEAIAPEIPVRPRCTMNDATIEAVAPALVTDARLLLQRDELAGWLSSMERYSGGSDRPFWLEAYGGRPYTVDRVKHGGRPLKIPSLLVSINGGIQPDRLMEFVHASADDGLFARMLWFWPDPVPLTRPSSAPNNSIATRVLTRLRGLMGEQCADGGSRPLIVRFTDDASDYFDAWRGANRKAEESASGIFLGFLGKMPGLCVRIAGLLQLVQWAEGGRDEPQMTVEQGAVERAVRLIDTYLKDHARRTFGEAILPPNERDAVALARFLRSNKIAAFNLREMYRDTNKLRSVFQRNAARAKAAVGVLTEAHITRLATQKTAGRSAENYLVNPALWAAQ